MPSEQPRTPEGEVSKDAASGFVANIYDGEYLIQVQPYENGYQLSLASKTGMGDAAFLRTYGRLSRWSSYLCDDLQTHSRLCQPIVDGGHRG